MKCITAWVCSASVALTIAWNACAGEGNLDSTEYIFSDETVVGGLLGIDEAVVTVRPRGVERSLIKVRSHFVKEMLKSVESM
jgi:hypothetical protein